MLIGLQGYGAINCTDLKQVAKKLSDDCLLLVGPPLAAGKRLPQSPMHWTAYSPPATGPLQRGASYPRRWPGCSRALVTDLWSRRRHRIYPVRCPDCVGSRLTRRPGRCERRWTPLHALLCLSEEPPKCMIDARMMGHSKRTPVDVLRGSLEILWVEACRCARPGGTAR